MDKQQAIAILQARQADLRRMGVEHIALFGSVARDEQHERSDIDLAVRLDRTQRIGLLRLIEIELQLAAMLGADVDVVTEPVSRPRLQSEIDRDRVRVF